MLVTAPITSRGFVFKEAGKVKKPKTIPGAM